MTHCTIDSPLGPLTIQASDGAVTALRWQTQTAPHESGTDPVLHRTAQQLSEYFAGTRQNFTIPLRVTASDFQRAVCDAIAQIPFGETRTYGDLARNLHAPAQAIGQGCGGNPIPILIPCHRVLGATGLGGFSGVGGIEDKVWLLRHEGAAGLLI